MILILLGTQDKKFTRILDSVEKLLEENKINEEVVVQAGYSSNYKSKYMKIFDLISSDDLEELIKKSDIIITHGGVGSIVSALKHEKPIIAVARLKKYDEHINDHQLQIINNFSKEGYIIELDKMNDLYDKLILAKSFKPKKYKSNNKKFINIIEKEIEKL